MSSVEFEPSTTPEVARANDVLADLDELDSVMGVETSLDQEDLKPKQVSEDLKPLKPTPFRRRTARELRKMRNRRGPSDSSSDKTEYVTAGSEQGPSAIHSRYSACSASSAVGS